MFDDILYSYSAMDSINSEYDLAEATSARQEARELARLFWFKKCLHEA